MASGRTDGDAARASLGFTLIEVMAVVILVALLLSAAIPNIAGLSRVGLRSQSKILGATIELARQRAVITGKPHRLVLDLDNATYHLEWQLRRDPESSEEETLSYQDRQALLFAPPLPEWSFEPIPVRAGNTVALHDPLHFAGVDTPEGWIDDGIVYVHFDEDGTAEPSAIVMANDLDNRRILEVLPLADAVRIYDES